MIDVIADAWPWLIPAFLIGLLCGWGVTLAWCRDHHPRDVNPTSTVKAVSVAKPVSVAKAAPTSATAQDLSTAAKVLGVKVRLDDLELIEGVGPRIAGLLKAGGITTWADLGAAAPARLRKVLEAGGSRYNLADPSTWPKQARLLAEGRWAEFKTLTDKLVGGR